MKKLNRIWQKQLTFAVISFLFTFVGCSSISKTPSGTNIATPSETIKSWNVLMEENQVEEAYALFDKEASLTESASNEKKPVLKGADLKNQLVKTAAEFKKYKDAGKPHPSFEIINEKITGDKASVFIAYNMDKGGRKRIDFQLSKESGVWKIKEMDGYGFTFQ